MDFKINFITFSPTPTYIDYIGGIMVCHNLAHSLSLLGENSYIYANNTKPTSNVQTIPWGTELEYDKENTILIVPAGAGEHTFEHSIPENLKNIPNKIRWLINDQVKTYPKEDKMYQNSTYFKTLNPDSNISPLKAYDVDFNVFYNKNLKRNGGCFYTKGQHIQTQHHKDSDLCLDNIYSLSTQERNIYLSKIFNEKEYFVCYSHRSSTAKLAALCGCVTIVIPYDDTPYKYWYENIPSMRCGISYGPNNIQHAKDTIHLVKQNIQTHITNANNSIENMRNESYTWLKQKYKIDNQ